VGLQGHRALWHDILPRAETTAGTTVLGQVKQKKNRMYWK
jgi:hypothetical protein